MTTDRGRFGKQLPFLLQGESAMSLWPKILVQVYSNGTKFRPLITKSTIFHISAGLYIRYTLVYMYTMTQGKKVSIFSVEGTDISIKKGMLFHLYSSYCTCTYVVTCIRKGMLFQWLVLHAYVHLCCSSYSNYL